MTTTTTRTTTGPTRPASATSAPVASVLGERAVRHSGRGARPAGCPSARGPVRATPALAPRPDAPAPAGTHLTARGRTVVLAVLVLLLLAAFSLGRTVAVGSTAAPVGPAVEQVTVLPGDTLWSVAQELAPGQDPRPVVDQIRRLNDLSSAELTAGQQLLLPAAP